MLQALANVGRSVYRTILAIVRLTSYKRYTYRSPQLLRTITPVTSRRTLVGPPQNRARTRSRRATATPPRGDTPFLTGSLSWFRTGALNRLLS